MKKELLSLFIFSLLALPVFPANRVKTVVDGEVILAADWNAEFDNIYDNVTHTISGTWTFDKAGTPITIKPASAPVASTVLLDVQNTSGTNLWKIDYEADVTRAGTDTWTIDDATTNATTTFSTFAHTTTGTAAAGLGLRFLYKLEDAAGNSDNAAAFDVSWSDATSGSEDADFILSLTDAGTLTEWGRFLSTGNLQLEGATADGFETTFSITDPTADRTYTFPDAAIDFTLVGATTLTDGGVLFGSGTGLITASAVLANGELLIGDGTTDPTVATLTGTANEVTVTNGAGTITLDIPDAVTLSTLTLTNDLTVANGGTGASTFTDGGILLGSGTGAFTALGVAANGEIPIGDGTTDPVLGTITGTANQVTVTDGAGSITLDFPDDLIIDGTTPSIRIGDGGAEDIQLDFNADANDWYLCRDDTDDDFKLGRGLTCGTTSSLTLDDTTGDVTFEGDLVASGTGPHAIGGATAGSAQMRFLGNFTSDGTSIVGLLFQVDGNLTGASGDTLRLSGTEITSSVTTQTASESIATVSTLFLDEPAITDNLTGGGVITDAYTLVITGAPTEGARNNALGVEAGSVRIGAVGTNDGHVHILSPSTSTAGLVVEMPTSSTVNAFDVHYAGVSAIDFRVTSSVSRLQIVTKDLGDDIAGPTIFHGRNNNATNSNSGTFAFEDIGGTFHYMWLDNSASPGDFRVHTAAPAGATADTAGTIVGTQASPRYIKDILREWTDEEAYKILDQILETPVYDFTYKSGKYNRTFTGIAIEDGEEPWYGYDVAGPKDYVPEGTAKALNEVNVAGYMILSVRALNLKIKELRHEISQLRSNRSFASVQ